MADEKSDEKAEPAPPKPRHLSYPMQHRIHEHLICGVAEWITAKFQNTLPYVCRTKQKGHPFGWPNYLILLVGGAGFEPATLAV